MADGALPFAINERKKTNFNDLFPIRGIGTPTVNTIKLLRKRLLLDQEP